jgi:eukaryotic-like serine/threonine-protein kinase
MPLVTPTQIGPYRIIAPLGAGGMGEVYRARDDKLGRDVAVKVLPTSFVHDPDRLARFDREARLLASLNHPRIAAIYGFEDSAGVPALVLELIEGPTLADRIAHGPLGLTQALGIAGQIADALETAHEKGIVHRDLKPANIKVRPNGDVKVLDFGLAKVLEAGAEGAAGGAGRAGGDVSDSPTITVGATQHGVILGTAAYMSPEQARGLVVDKRTDIWAFGCVMYEMLAGRQAFLGNNFSDTIASILRSEPEWKQLPASTPQKIRDLLRRCLQKDPQRRLRDIADARIEIDEAQTETPVNPDAAGTPSRRWERVGWMSAVAILGLLVVAGILAGRRPGSDIVPETRLEIATPPTTDPVSLSISPDGRKIVFVATDNGKPRLWLRSLDSVTARPLVGTESAYYPFWSPDNESVGFFADGKLKRLDLETTSVQVLADASAGRGGTWNRDGVILFAPQAGPIFRIPASGGERTQVTQLDEQRRSHRFPQFLPDGRHFLYYVTGTVASTDVRGLYVGQLDGTDTHRLTDADVGGVFVGTGHLLFIRQGTMFAQPFDPVRLSLSGAPFPVASPVVTVAGVAASAISVSATGLLAYRTGPPERRQFTWFDRSGRELGTVGEHDANAPSDPAISPDGNEIVFSREIDGSRDLWLLEASRGTLRRLTFGPSTDRSASWYPDGSRIVFSSNRDGSADLYQKLSGGAGEEELLLSTSEAKQAADFSPDGRFLLFRAQHVTTRYDLWAVEIGKRASGQLELRDGKKPFVVVQTNSDERDGQFSPDGRWIAYESDESGRFEVYVQPFPGAGPKHPISTSGGAQVRWSRNGKELFYIALDNRLMAVPIRLDAEHQMLAADAPIPLFMTHVGAAANVLRQQYVVSPDGQRFLMNTIKEDASTSPITIVQNWKPPR